jgi:hypothetical protein
MDLPPTKKEKKKIKKQKTKQRKKTYDIIFWQVCN